MLLWKTNMYKRPISVKGQHHSSFNIVTELRFILLGLIFSPALCAHYRASAVLSATSCLTAHVVV